MGFILLGISKIINKPFYSIYFLSGLFAAYLVGQIYTHNFNKYMEKKTRLNATIIYSIIMAFLGIWFLWAMKAPILFFSIFLIIGSLVYGVAIYYFIKLGEKKHAKI